MTQEDKDLLLKDLCARLPYHTNLYSEYADDNWAILTPVVYAHTENCSPDEIKIKPYLFPLSNMTEEQEKELITITDGKFRYMWGDITNAIPRKNTSEWGISENAFISSIKVINSLYIWLLKNHFDYHRLIEKGLAIDATGLNIY